MLIYFTSKLSLKLRVYCNMINYLYVLIKEQHGFFTLSSYNEHFLQIYYVNLSWVFSAQDNLEFIMMNCRFFFVACLTCTPDSIELVIGAHGTDVSVGVRLLSGETLLQVKNSTGRRWNSPPGPCRQHGHCCKRAKPLNHPFPAIDHLQTFY